MQGAFTAPPDSRAPPGNNSFFPIAHLGNTNNNRPTDGNSSRHRGARREDEEDDDEEEEEAGARGVVGGQRKTGKRIIYYIYIYMCGNAS